MSTEALKICPECGATWQEGKTCQDDFHQMLYWENEYPGLGKVHNYLVLCYYIQHPSLYSPEGLRNAMQLMVDFHQNGLSTEEVRQRNRSKVSSTNRNWKIKATPTSHGAYQYPVQWPMRAADVIAGGPENYCENVRKWAASMYEALTTSGNYNY
ncbi:MAG TPA: DUF5946 family protein [Chloroflexia bacterium]|nr:DUF5946 family protein [Chloroflexia bacterium]